MQRADLTHAGFGTAAIHAGQGDTPFGTLTTPIYQTSTYRFETVEQAGKVNFKELPGYVYSRGGNPTTTVLEEKVAFLEGAEAGLVTASGMGAIGSTFVGLLKAGDHIVSGDGLYGCTSFTLREVLSKFGVDVTFVNSSHIEEIERAIRPETKIIYFETPTNPTMQLTDIAAVAEIAHRHGIRVVVDNTFAPPPAQYPIKLGADIVVHSATKYLNGHGDTLCGVVVGKADDIALIRTTAMTKLCGSVPTPFTSYLVLRGMKTLELRMKRHTENGLALARYFEQNPSVARVYYPGLESDPQHELAKRQQNGYYGGVLSIELKDDIKGLDSFAAAKKMCNALRLVSIAVSLGDPETLIEHAASMTHDNIPREERLAAGISDGLIRVSAGLENIEDIIADFEQAFAAI